VLEGGEGERNYTFEKNPKKERFNCNIKLMIFIKAWKSEEKNERFNSYL